MTETTKETGMVAEAMIWENDGSDHSEIAGDTICIECADSASGDEDDPHPSEVPGWRKVKAGTLYCNYCGKQPGVKAGEIAPPAEAGGGETMTEKDASVLKLLVFFLFKQPMNRRRHSRAERELSDDVLEEIGGIETPREDLEETYDKLRRLEFNGGPLIHVETSAADDDNVVEIRWLTDDSRIPGGTRALALAVVFRLKELVGTPWTPEAEDEAPDELKYERIEALARSIRIRPRGPTVH